MKITRNFFKLLNKSIFLSKIVRILIAIFRYNSSDISLVLTLIYPGLYAIRVVCF
jgi:hypothetical protein